MTTRTKAPPTISPRRELGPVSGNGSHKHPDGKGIPRRVVVIGGGLLLGWLYLQSQLGPFVDMSTPTDEPIWPGVNPDQDMLIRPEDLTQQFQLPLDKLVINDQQIGQAIPVSTEPDLGVTIEAQPVEPTARPCLRKNDVLVFLGDVVSAALAHAEVVPPTPTRPEQIKFSDNNPTLMLLPNVLHPYYDDGTRTGLLRSAGINTINELYRRLTQIYGDRLQGRDRAALSLFNELMTQATIISPDIFRGQTDQFVRDQLTTFDVTTGSTRRAVVFTPDDSDEGRKSGGRLFEVARSFYGQPVIVNRDTYRYYESGNTRFILPTRSKTINSALRDAAAMGGLTEVDFMTDIIASGLEISSMLSQSRLTGREECSGATLRIFSAFTSLNAVEALPKAIWHWRLFGGAHFDTAQFNFRYLIQRWLDLDIYDPQNQARLLSRDEKHGLLTALRLPYYAPAGILDKPGMANTEATYHPLFSPRQAAKPFIFLRQPLSES